MTNSKSASPNSKKKKRFLSNITSIAESGGYTYSRLYQNILYQLGITIEDNNGLIFLENEHTKLPKYFQELNNLFLFLRYITSWFQKFHPNKGSLVYFLREYLFLLKVSTFGKNILTMLYKFSNPFKSYDLKELSKKTEESDSL